MNEKALSNLVPANVTKTAWAIRREVSVKHGVRIMFVSWKDCLTIARGKKLRTGIRDIFGSVLGSALSALNEFVLSPECPVVFGWREIEREGLLCVEVMKDFYRHFSNLKRVGKIQQNEGGWFSVAPAARPYSNEIF